MRGKALCLVCTLITFSNGIKAEVINFDGLQEGKPPAGFTEGLTGKGAPGKWLVQKDPTAPSAPNVLAQTDADAVSYRFPICILDNFSARDVILSVGFKALSGKEDQAAGMVWRYKDTDNYYVVRANALEQNVVLYKVEKGKRTDLKPKGAGPESYGVKTAVPSGVWQTLGVDVRSSTFRVMVNGKELFQVEDTSFGEAGKVGLWTKADSVTLFDNLNVSAVAPRGR